jgi:hypothetical protein
MAGTTLESRYEAKIAGFAETRARLAEAARSPALDERARARLDAERRQLEAQEVEYILQSAPFIKEYTSDEVVAPGGDDEKPRKGGGGIMDSYMQVTSKRNRNAVLQKYLMQVEQDITADMVICTGAEPDELTCPRCDVAMVVDARQSALVCTACASTMPYLGNTEANLSYQDEITQNVVSSFSYKRLNHFSEWLNAIQARATTEIGDDVIDAIRAEFKKNRTSQRKDITPAKVRAYLKKLNLNKLYEHSHYICTLINGVPAPTLEPELEARLKHMFVSIQAPFQRAIEGTTRKNFLSYSYCLFKMCELLGRDDLLCHFSLLKSAEKLHAQDKIWKAITAELQWEFIPSV